jgi:hypothetical protein
MWDREFAAISDVRVERLTVRNPVDLFFPNYSVQQQKSSCEKNYTAFFDLSGTDLPSQCVRQYSNSSSAQQPLTLLMRAAAKYNITVVLGLAWTGSAPKDAAGLQSLAALQQKVAARLWKLYGAMATLGTKPRTVLIGAYTEVEMSNCHPLDFSKQYISHYLAPLSRYITSMYSSSRTPFIFADPYFEPKKSCLSAAEYGNYWRSAFLAAPGFTLIAPQDGVGECV